MNIFWIKKACVDEWLLQRGRRCCRYTEVNVSLLLHSLGAWYLWYHQDIHNSKYSSMISKIFAFFNNEMFGGFFYLHCLTCIVMSKVEDLLREVPNSKRPLQEMQRKGRQIYLWSLNGYVCGTDRLEADHSHLWNENLQRADRAERSSGAPQ